ncbi:MAG TPA: CorA family divalent cation transporter, partial [Saprospiraceae bacterium]|nr:CorA family divalent cation transporter [Saprospiraceae bacterium]
MIRYYTREKRRLVQLTEPEPGCWVHLSPPFAPDELDDVGRQLGFDPVFLTDSLDLDERARYERDEDIRFILINTPVKNAGAQEENEAYFITVPIGIVLTIEHVVTISAVENAVLSKFLDN